MRRTLSLLFLGPVVFASGAAVMVLEVVGTRVLRPAFGSGLHIWAALISVTLLALAGGYFLGGWVADRWPRRGTLSAVLALSAAALLGVALLGARLLLGLERLEVRSGALLGALLLFGPPLMGLGMVSPLAVRLAVPEVGAAGRTAGVLYGLSTLGSVAGTLGAAFLLLPHLPHRTALLGVAGGLGLLALGVAGSGWGRGSGGAVFLAALAAAAAPTPRRPAGILATAAGPRGQLVVSEWEGERYLFLDGVCQSHVPADPRAPVRCEYIQTLGAVARWRPKLRRLYLVGLGGGALLRLLAPARPRVDVADVDPRTWRLARRFFGWTPWPEVRFHAGDGRRILRRLGGPFDAVVVDLLTVDAVPVHLYTVEAFREVRARLAPEGILALNTALVLDPDGLSASASLFRTLRQVFPHVACYYAHEDPLWRLQNRIFFASPAPLPEDPLLREREVKFTLHRGAVACRWVDGTARPRAARAQGILLCDGFAPLDLLLATTSDAYRALFRQRFPEVAWVSFH